MWAEWTEEDLIRMTYLEPWLWPWLALFWPLLCSRARWYTHSWITLAARTRFIRMSRWCTLTFAKTKDSTWTEIKHYKTSHLLIGCFDKSWENWRNGEVFFVLFMFCLLEAGQKCGSENGFITSTCRVSSINISKFWGFKMIKIIFPVNKYLYVGKNPQNSVRLYQEKVKHLRKDKCTVWSDNFGDLYGTLKTENQNIAFLITW